MFEAEFFIFKKKKDFSSQFGDIRVTVATGMDLVLPSKLGAGRCGRRDDNMERCGVHSFWLLSFLKAHISSHGS